jgi:hypothetical protein
MKTWLRTLWKKSGGLGINFEFTTRRGLHVHLRVTWRGVFLWCAVAAWLIFGY